MKNLSILFSLLILAGCATTDRPPVIGSATWHTNRLAEIQASYDLGEIEQSEYLSLKNEVDQVYVDYKASRRPQTSTGIFFGVGGGHHHRHRRHH